LLKELITIQQSYMKIGGVMYGKLLYTYVTPYPFGVLGDPEWGLLGLGSK
jgi:hypothetical protein